MGEHVDTPPAVARSPIEPAAPTVVVHGWEVSGRHSSAPLRLTDCTPLTKVLVRGRSDGPAGTALGVPFGRARRDPTGALVVGLLPDGWLLLAAPGSGEAVVNRLAAGRDSGHATVVDVTHAHALVRLTGAAAASTLEKLCTMDLADATTPNGAVFRSLLAGLTATVVRDDQAGTLSYLLCCNRSTGRYLFDVLLDAGTEFEIGIDGFGALHP